MYKHIGLYVNDYTLDLGAKGRKSVELLFRKALELQLIPAIEKDLFLPKN